MAGNGRLKRHGRAVHKRVNVVRSVRAKTAIAQRYPSYRDLAGNTLNYEVTPVLRIKA
ncbi:hypothetical protein D3C86_2005660 [compost metagenome]